jgi:phosphoribosylanthranilate isomerase
VSALRIKLCGMRTAGDAVACAEAGADEIGVVFAARSRRRVSLAEAREIRSALPAGIPLVGVFQDATLEELAEAVSAVPLAAVQLHGALPGDAAPRSLPVPLYRALHVALPGGALELAGDGLEGFARVLLDGPHGGSGQGFDWSQVPAARPRLGLPIFLAGGLSPANVGAAIRAALPDGVDVSSGIEGPDGFKDPARVRAFVAAARAAADALVEGEGAPRWT